MASKQPAVGIIMGSQSNWQTMHRAAEAQDDAAADRLWAESARIAGVSRSPR
jgi:phosphoribosylcarboxyaminoimidazole (NCAIR) mutase